MRKSVSRVDFPEREEIAGEAGAAYLPDKAPESLEDFLKSGVDEAENAQNELEGLRGESAYATPSQLRALCFAPSVKALSAPEIPVPMAGLVVAESSWTLAAPILLGGKVEVGATVASIRRSERGTEVTVRGVVFDDGGLVYAEETLYIAKRLTGEPREWGERLPFGGFDLRRRRGVNSMGRLDVGNRPAVAEREFTVADSRLWARYTGDVNPIHMSSVAAKVFGFRRAILHGAAVEAWAMNRLGLDGTARCWGQAKFRAPALLPARLELIDMGRASSDSRAPSDSRDFAVLDGKSGRDLVHLSYGGVGLERYSKGGDRPSGRIVLPRQNGRTSSSVLARGMALAAATADPRLAERVKSAEPWREGYRAAMTDLSRVDAPSRGSEAARAGLAWLTKSLHFADGRRIGEARAVEVRGGSWKVSGSREPRRELSLELDGRDYRGQSLLALLDAWRRRGFIRRSAYDALAEVIDDPGILDLEGWTFACLGASAALSPAPSLLAWGADVAAPVRAGQEKNSALIDAAKSGAGTLILPPAPLDVVRAPEAVAGWIAALDGRIAIVDTLYAPGAKFLLAEAGADVVESLVTRARPDTALAWYGSPTDAYVLSEPP
ncbi:MAG: MaoC/PaaZ C-terminal domain-containing protein, partial [Peptidiphaga gingivicola]